MKFSWRFRSSFHHRSDRAQGSVPSTAVPGWTGQTHNSQGSKSDAHASAKVPERARMKKEMLINVLQPEECRIAIIEDGILEELYVERTSHESYTGNIYKGKIVNLEPAIQAAFVDFSVGRNGFLHVSDVEPQYFDRHPGEHLELDPAPRDRGRERERDPRRGRGRGRDDRRRPPASEAGDATGEPPPPPRAPDRPRERGREIPRDRDRERGRERERPDLSIRGRRDRSEPPPPRRFGEGLVEPQDLPAPPAHLDESPQVPPRAQIEEQPPRQPQASSRPPASLPTGETTAAKSGGTRAFLAGSPWSTASPSSPKASNKLRSPIWRTSRASREFARRSRSTPTSRPAGPSARGRPLARTSRKRGEKADAGSRTPFLPSRRARN